MEEELDAPALNLHGSGEMFIPSQGPQHIIVWGLAIWPCLT